MKQPRFSTQRVPSAHTDFVVFEKEKFPLLRGSFVSPLSAVEIIRGVVRKWATVEDSAFIVDHFLQFQVTAAVMAARCLRRSSFRLLCSATFAPQCDSLRSSGVMIACGVSHRSRLVWAVNVDVVSRGAVLNAPQPWG